MTEIKIEKDIPLPVTATKYPFADMEDGDSIFLTCAEADLRATLNRVSQAAKKFIKRNRPPGGPKGEWTHVIRKVEGGVRCWFVKKGGKGA